MTASYRSYAESSDAADRDNAEFYRLGAIALRQVRVEITRDADDPKRKDGYVLTTEGVVAEFIGACLEYATTGKKVDDVAGEIAGLRASFLSTDAPEDKAAKKKKATPPAEVGVPAPELASADSIDMIAAYLRNVLT